MKIVGLITEYNPFHNGHLYHIEKAKEITGADAAVVVMSGNYVQRGAPAIMPKHLRAEVALEAGVPVVMELPACFATGSAEYFAAGAVSLFEQLGCVDSICFGSECGDYARLEQIAHVVADEPEEYKFSLQEGLRKGLSFPRARQLALKACLRDDSLDAVLEHRIYQGTVPEEEPDQDIYDQAHGIRVPRRIPLGELQLRVGHPEAPCLCEQLHPP